MGYTMSPQRRTGVAVGMALALGVVLGLACKIPDPDHCANQSEPANAWCNAHYNSKSYCSPCIADNNGCVEFEPFSCADYEPDAEMDAEMDAEPQEGQNDSPMPLDMG